MPARAALVPGTLDLLILRAVSLGRLHGYGVLLRIEQSALYQALYRLEQQGLLATEWGASDNNRRAKFYELTSAGRRRLKQETTSWTAFVRAMTAALSADPMEA